MERVIFDEQRKLRKMGYQFIKSKNNKKALLLKGKKVLARFESHEEDGVTAKIGKKVVCKGISKMNIREAYSFSSAEIVIEVYYLDSDTCDEPLWCEILSEGKPILI